MYGNDMVGKSTCNTTLQIVPMLNTSGLYYCSVIPQGLVPTLLSKIHV